MKTLVKLLIILYCITLGAIAQTPHNYVIRGEIVDSITMKPVGFATVALRDSTTNVKAIAADGNGKFSITHNKKGEYTLNITYVGYNAVVRKMILDKETVIDLGKIPFSEGVNLGEVVVVGQLITADIDKVAYNTSADPETPSLTALEMMRKVPMLTVDGEDNIQLKGDTNYKILVNGKTNSMMSKNYKEVLRSMPAASIKSIEVITDPPAKYDAEGLGGIINIVTERKTNNAYNGSLSLRGDQWGSLGGNGYIAASLGKLTLSANASLGNYRGPEATNQTRTVNDLSENARYVNNDAISKSVNLFGNLSFDASYEIDSLNLLSMSVWGYMGNVTTDNNSHAEYFNSQHVLQQGYHNVTGSKNMFSSISGNIDWQRTFKKPDETLTVSYRLEAAPASSAYQSDLIGFGGYIDRHQRSDNKANGSEHTFQIDYFNPLTKMHNIEVGAKFVLRPNTSDTYNEILRDDMWVEDRSRKNDLDYMQYIAAAYAGYQFKLKKFSAKAGLRAEYTVNTGTFKLAENNNVFNRYFNIVPYITTSFQINKSQTIRLGYTQRLQRPSIWYLNPYVNETDPMNITTGNPNLESEIRHAITLNYNAFSKVGNLNVSLAANFGNNAIEQVTTINDKGVMFTAPENCGRRQNYTAYVNGTLNMLKGKMRFTLGVNGGYSIIESVNDKRLNNSGFNYGGNLSLYAATWKNANVNAFAAYWSTRLGLQSNSAGVFFHSVSLSQSLLKDKKLRLNLAVSNPFEKNMTYRSETFGNGYRSVSEFINTVRSVNLSIQWNFGKSMTQVKKAKRGINNDDKLGGGTGTGAAGGTQQGM